MPSGYWWNDLSPETHPDGAPTGMTEPHPLVRKEAFLHSLHLALYPIVPLSEDAVWRAVEQQLYPSLLVGAVQCALLALSMQLDKGVEVDLGHVREHLAHAFEWATETHRRSAHVQEGSDNGTH